MYALVQSLPRRKDIVDSSRVLYVRLAQYSTGEETTSRVIVKCRTHCTIYISGLHAKRSLQNKTKISRACIYIYCH